MIKSKLRSLLILFLLGFICFSNGLKNEFLIDDHAFFEEKLQNIKFLPLHFLPDKNKALKIEGQSADPFYRPLATVVPMIAYLNFKNNVVGHHWFNLILFVLASWSIYLFLRFLQCSEKFAFLAAALYMIHPINGVAVNYITASVFSVQVMLMLGVLYLIKSASVIPERPNIVIPERFSRGSNSLDSRLKHSGMTRIIISCVLYLFATWCHETAMALPFYAFAMMVIFHPQDKIKSTLIYAWKKTWPLFVVLGIIGIFRSSYASLDASIVSKISQYDMTFPQYLATLSMLLGWYVSRLFWPMNVVLIMAHQPLKELLWPWILLFVGMIALVGYLMWVYRKDKISLFGLTLLSLGLAPTVLACFFQPIHGLMIEPHWYLFPVIGFFIFIAGVFERVLTANKMFGRVGLAIIVFVLVFFTRWHNWVWAQEIRYCTHWLNQSPAFVAVNGYLAKAYELKEDNEMARHHYYYMLDRGYKDYISYTNLGLMDLKERNWESAKKNFLKVMELDPHASVAVSNLGVLYFKDENYKEALKYFERSRDLNKWQILPYLNIAQTHLKLKNPQKAIDTLEEVLNIVPGQENAMVDVIKIYMERKDTANTLRIAKLMARHSQNPYTLRNAAMLLDQGGFKDESRRALQKANAILTSAGMK